MIVQFGRYLEIILAVRPDFVTVTIAAALKSPAIVQAVSYTHLLIPDRARQRILDIASTQFEDGSAYHQYQPLTKKGNSDIGSGFNDDPLWLIAGTAAYIKETGDYSILDERTPYDNDDSKATDLMEHLRRSFHYTMEHRGPHKLPLIGRADWNDCLNLNCFSTEPGESFQTFGPSEGPNAESVFIAGMFVRYGKDYVEICRHRGMAEEAAPVSYTHLDVYKRQDSIVAIPVAICVLLSLNFEIAAGMSL